MIIETAKRYSEELKLFAFLHDLGKAECLVLQNSKSLNELRRLSKEERERRIKAIREELKQIRSQHLLKQSLKQQVELPPVYLLSLEEWEEILRELGNDIGSALQFLQEHYDKTFFRKEKEYFEEERDHGEESAVLVRKALSESQIRLSEDEQKILDLILKIIENHEVHFQVFTTARSAKNYETHIKSRFEEDEINLFYTACFIDIAASLGDDKKPNFQGFANMVIAKKNYELIQNSGLTDENKRNLMNLDILPEELEKRIEEFKKKEKLDQALRENKLTEEDIEEVFAKLNFPDDIKEGLRSLIGKNVSEVLGYLDKTLPPHLKRLLGEIRKVISERLERELEL
jgi:G:T/U-mismatch repair DNA glycosylase